MPGACPERPHSSPGAPPGERRRERWSWRRAWAELLCPEIGSGEISPHHRDFVDEPGEQEAGEKDDQGEEGNGDRRGMGGVASPKWRSSTRKITWER